MNRDMNKIKATVELIEVTVGLLGSAYFGSEGYNIFLAALIGIGLSFLVRLPFALYAGFKAGKKAWDEAQ